MTAKFLPPLIGLHGDFLARPALTRAMCMSYQKPKARGLRIQLPCCCEALETRALLASHPSVADVNPENRATNVSPDTFIACDVSLVGVGEVVDSASVKKAGDVTLLRVSDGASVPGDANTTGGGDAIIFTPS